MVLAILVTLVAIFVVLVDILETLVAIYRDKNQLYNIRIETLNILSAIDNPIIQEALGESLTNTMFVES